MSAAERIAKIKDAVLARRPITITESLELVDELARLQTLCSALETSHRVIEQERSKLVCDVHRAIAPDRYFYGGMEQELVERVTALRETRDMLVRALAILGVVGEVHPLEGSVWTPRPPDRPSNGAEESAQIRAAEIADLIEGLRDRLVLCESEAKAEAVSDPALGDPNDPEGW